MITEFQDGFITKTKLNELVGGINNNTERLAEVDVIVLTDNTTKTVGSGGDFTTLNLAINWCKKVIPNGYKVTLQLMAGFVMAESVLLENVDLRFVTIISTNSDAIIIDRVSIIESCVFKGLNSYIPNIYEVNFTMNGVMDFGSTKTFMRVEGLGSYGEYRGNLDNIEYFSRVYDCGEIKFIIYDGISMYGFSFSFNSKGMLGGGFRAKYRGVYLDWHSEAFFGNGRLTVDYNGITAERGSKFSLFYGDVTNLNSGYEGFTVLTGSIISANGSTGTLSQTANTITANGIIFK